MKTKINYIVLIITLMGSLAYLVFSLIKTDVLNSVEQIFNASILFVFTFLFSFYVIKNKELKRSPMVSIGSSILAIYFIINTLVGLNIVKLPEKETVGNFVNSNITEALDWAKANNIAVNQVYENSDTFPAYKIISQNIKVGTGIDKIKKIEFIVSSGPSYEKTVIVPNMVGWDADKVLKYIKDSYLINAKAEFIVSEQPKDILLTQDKNGEQRRDTVINLTFSIGPSTELGEITMTNLTNKPSFEAIFFLKKNGLKYNLEYEFSNTVERNYVIKQSPKANEKVTNTTSITLTISKGKQIIVPDLSKMEVDEITNWIIDNKLKVKFEESYDQTIKLGKIIMINYKKGDILEEGSLVVITTSKGQLKVPTVNSINELRSWASTNGISLVETYDFNDSLSSGSIIAMNPAGGSIINNGGSINVTISQGKAIIVPNFIGKTKSTITSNCKSIGLNCTFFYSDYSSTALDTALSQNKKAGSTVVSGTYVSIGLSKGIAKSFTIEISESQLTLGNADKTISTLSSWFNSKYPSVTFSFIKKSSNTYPQAGFIHESSPIKDGSSVTQGRSYQVWITN